MSQHSDSHPFVLMSILVLILVLLGGFLTDWSIWRRESLGTTITPDEATEWAETMRRLHQTIDTSQITASPIDAASITAKPINASQICYDEADAKFIRCPGRQPDEQK